jgi:hypothetical protein
MSDWLFQCQIGSSVFFPRFFPEILPFQPIG